MVIGSIWSHTRLDLVSILIYAVSTINSADSPVIQLTQFTSMVSEFSML